MGSWFKTVWSTTWGKIVIFAATAVIIVSGGIAIDYSQLSYIIFPRGQSSAVSQQVIVFVGGMNTTNTSDTAPLCTAPTFDTLAALLVKDLHVTDPYSGHCPATVSMKNSPVNFAYYSYIGGSLDPTTGVWDPAPYTWCDADTIPLKHDVSLFVQMLQAYRAFYPHAHFTIVAHSLGGLVALEGASAFVAQFGSGIIDKLIALDSPLHGVKAPYPGNKCELFAGPILSALNTVYNTPHLAETMVSQLEGAGTSVYTLGNTDDCLYQLVVSCNIHGWALNNPQTQFVSGAYVHAYTVPDGMIGFAPGHGAILANNQEHTLSDLVRYILAPNVTISQPKPQDVAWFGSTGVPLSYAATVRCDWGAAKSATAILDVDGSPPYFAGAAVPTSQANTLALNGVVNLPADASGPQATFYINAGATACQYPGVSPSVYPDDSDYLGGESTAIPVSLDGEKIAVGVNGTIRLASSAGGSVFNQRLDYSNNNQSDGVSSIQSIAWSNDGTKVAYLVQTASTQADTLSTSSDLYVTSSSLSNPARLTRNLPNAVAVAWNATGDKIAVLEETEGHAGPGPVGFYFTPSIVIVDASTGIGRQHISLPASSTTFTIECGFDCFPYRARFQWAANGSFFISYDNQGNTLVTPSGKAIPLDTQNGSPLGAMNAQGTMIAYPIVPQGNSGSLTINLVSIDPASGQPGSPTTLVTLPLDPFSDAAVAFSPDSSHLGVCNGQNIFVIDIHHPNTMQKVATLPSSGGNSFLGCEQLQWNPDGQGLVMALVGYNTGADALAILPLNGGTPAVLFGCNVSYTTSFQFDPNGGGNCSYTYPLFALQPTVQKQPASPTVSEQGNNARLLAQSATIHVSAGDSFVIYFDYENTGTSTWSDAGSDTLACDQFYMKASQCMRGEPQRLNGASIPPGNQATFYVTLTAPAQPGTYQTAWDIHTGSSIFGQNHVFVTIDVTPSVPQAQPTPTPIAGLAPFVHEWWIAQGAIILTIHSDGSAIYQGNGETSTIQFTHVSGNTAYGTVTGGAGISISAQGPVISVGGAITVTLLDSSDVQISDGWQLCEYPGQCAY